MMVILFFFFFFSSRRRHTRFDCDWSSDVCSSDLRHYGLPRPGSKPMRVSLPPVSVPVYLATLSPKMLELTGEIADGWLGTSFVPERADAYLTHLDAGLARA